MFYVYILFSQVLNRYYIGQTNDPIGRLRRHNQSNHGFTSKGKPWQLVYQEKFATRFEACQRELQLKSWKSRDRIAELAENGSAHLSNRALL